MLKYRIFSGEYRPGDRLPAEREAADMLGVGRPAVREAYRALELIGIVKIRKGKQGGAFITERDRQTVTDMLSELIRLRQVDMSHLAEARLVLETDVARLAIRQVGAEEIASLRACVETAIERSKRGFTASVENLQFHLRLGEMSGNPILSMMLASTLDLLQMVIGAVAPSPEVSRANAEEHYAIIEALQSGDFERLRPVLEDHIRRSNGELIRLAKRSPLLAVPPLPQTKRAKDRSPTKRTEARTASAKGNTHGKK